MGEISNEEAFITLSEAARILGIKGESKLPLSVRRELAAFADIMEREKAGLFKFLKEIGTVLADTAIEIGSLLKLVEDLPPETREGLQALRDSLDRGVRDLKRLLMWVQPVGDLVKMGLREGITYFVEHSFSGLPVNVKVNLQGVPEKLPTILTLTLFRIIQEALLYSYRDAEASNIEINFVFEPQTLVFTILNDGAPFDEKKPEAFSGLIVMLEQARWLGGELRFYSGEKAMNKIEIRIPFAL